MLVLMKGVRGLFTVDNGKYYFPDRSWKDASEGLIDSYTVTRDKNNYAFIKSTMLETEDISLYEIDIDFNLSYRLVELGASKFIMSRSAYDNYIIYYKVDGKINTQIVSINSDTDILYSKYSKSLSFDKLEYISRIYSFKTEDKIYESLFKVLQRDFNMSTYERTDRIYILNNSIICFRKDLSSAYSGVSIDFNYAYYVDSNGKIHNINDCGIYSGADLKKLKITKTYMVSDLINMCVEYGISVNNFRRNADFSNNLNTVEVTVGDTHSILYLFDAENFSFEYYNSAISKLERDLVNLSIQRHKSIIQFIVKSLGNKSAIPVIRGMFLKDLIL